MFPKIKKMIQAVQLCLLMREFKEMVMCSDKYIKDLWNQFTRGLQHGLSQIDYKACWKANTTPAEILRSEFRERER